MYEPAVLRDKLAAFAVDIAAADEVRLDYSPRSIRKVEKILGKVHAGFKKSGDEDGLNGVAFNFAAYIIKVIESNYTAGVWARDHPQLGEETFPYNWQGQTLFPVAWCQKRIFDGKADNVWKKFKTLVLKNI